MDKDRYPLIASQTETPTEIARFGGAADGDGVTGARVRRSQVGTSVVIERPDGPTNRDRCVVNMEVASAAFGKLTQSSAGGLRFECRRNVPELVNPSLLRHGPCCVVAPAQRAHAGLPT